MASGTLAAPGDLDLAFAPEITELPLGPQATVDGSDVYLYGLDHVYRYGPDGRLDPTWSTAVGVPAGSPYQVFEATPWGDWLVGGSLNRFLDHRDGTVGPALLGAGLSVVCHPLDDGRFLVANTSSSGGVARYDHNGQRDQAFASRSPLTAANFDDGAGTVRTGGPWIAAAFDRLGRVIIGGNFRQAGTFARLGLARLKADGTVDPDWDPAPDAGITWTEAGGLSACPLHLSSAPDNAVVVLAQQQVAGGNATFQVLRINSAGEVTLSVAAGSSRPECPPVIQPDGRILIGGSFTHWGTRPVTGLVRLHPDGAVDESFAVTLGNAFGLASVHDLALDDQGRLIVVGAFDAVNGVPRPGLARLAAHTPPTQPAAAAISFSQPRVGTNAVLHLTAAVTGYPPPELQWFRDDNPLPGATHRGIRIEIRDGRELGIFSLQVSNALGWTNLVFPEVRLASASPAPGTMDPSFAVPLTHLTRVTLLLPLPDGRILVAGGAAGTNQPADRPMLVRLRLDGALDPEFGVAGVVNGDGVVEDLQVISGERVLVAGYFTQIAGRSSYGLATLDPQGRPIWTGTPVFDPPHVSAVIYRETLQDLGYVVAGSFTRVGQTPAYRLARLSVARELVTTFQSPLAPGQFVDELALDRQGRLLIGGARVYWDGAATSLVPVGLKRLLADGSLDPAFTGTTNDVRSIAVEFDGTLVVAPDPQRFTEDGVVLHGFDQGAYLHGPYRPSDPDHTAVWNRNTGLVMVCTFSGPLGVQLVRWDPTGQRDFRYHCVFLGSEIEACAALPDGGILVSERILISPPPGGARRLVRVAPDSDLKLRNPEVANGRFRVDLATQPGRQYEIRSKTSLTETSTLVATLEGDGYDQGVKVPAEEWMQFLELYRR